MARPPNRPDQDIGRKEGENLVADCPRCGAKKMTFDLFASVPGLEPMCEAFCQCRRCFRSTIFLVTNDRAINRSHQHQDLVNALKYAPGEVQVIRPLSLADVLTELPPLHVPEDISSIFVEASRCLAIGCMNAAGTMCRLCLDLATKRRMADLDLESPNKWTQEKLGPRLAWLFEHKALPASMKGLADCIKEDGNDGAHEGTLGAAEAGDLHDFTRQLLVHLYSNDGQIREAESRRMARRAAARSATPSP